MYDMIFKGFIALISLLLTTVLIPLIHSKTTAEQRMALLELIDDAVTAAEKIFPDSGQGLRKKKFVIEWLHDRGVSIDPDELDALVESAVYALDNPV